MARRKKRDPNQLPLICEQCSGGPIEVSQRGERVIVRCLSCEAIILTLIVIPRSDSAESLLTETEEALLELVSEGARAVYELIRREYKANGYAPSVRELQAALGWSSPNSVHHHLKRLSMIGLIERDYASARALRLPHVA